MTDHLTDADVERIDEEAREAALHAATAQSYTNPYAPATQSGVLFDHLFVGHYARENGK